MPGSDEKLLPKWPLRLALMLLLVGEALFVLLIYTEGRFWSTAMIVNSAGLAGLCVVTWRGISWGRWLLIAFLVWRVASIVWRVADVVISPSHLCPCQNRIGGTPVLVPLCLVVGVLLASRLGRASARAVT